MSLHVANVAEHARGFFFSSSRSGFSSRLVIEQKVLPILRPGIKSFKSSNCFGLDELFLSQSPFFFFDTITPPTNRQKLFHITRWRS